MLGKLHDVLAALPQRRESDRQDRQAMVEVLAEPPRADRLLEILAGRGDHPGVDRLAARAAEAAHGALLDHLQELGLQSLGHEPDLVEEDRAAVRGLEQAGLGLAGVGERALLEAEELRLEQGLGDGGAVDVDEGTARARPVPVHQLGQETLARAGLAQDEDRGQPARGLALVPEQPADLLAHAGDPGTVAQEPRQGRHRAPNPTRRSRRCRSGVEVDRLSPANWRRPPDPLRKTSRCSAPSAKFVTHYHGERNQQRLGNELITPETRPLRGTHMLAASGWAGCCVLSPRGLSEDGMSFRALRVGSLND